MGQYAVYAKSPMGVFVFSQTGELLYFKFFSKNGEKAVEEYLKASEKGLPLNQEVKEHDSAYVMLRQNFREYAKNMGFMENDSDLNKFLVDFGYHFSKKRLAGVIGKDRLVMQAVNALDDMQRVTNTFQERLYEWFSLHYPELRNSKDLQEKVFSYGRRDNFPGFAGSTGAELNESDESMLKEYAHTIQSLLKEQERLEKYVSDAMKEMAPTLSSLVDPILAARLVSYAGSLEKLARMPASTVQLLGAEKALFRHLKKRGKSPKYGIIFTSSAIQNASPENKGKAARLLASKLMMAAKIDFYSGRYEPRLHEELKEELKRI